MSSVICPECKSDQTYGVDTPRHWVQSIELWKCVDCGDIFEESEESDVE